MLLTTTAKAASCQSSPRRKNSSAPKPAPLHAYAAMCTFLRDDRSTKAPTTGSTNALAMVAKLVR
jgi:hypothetical protein